MTVRLGEQANPNRSSPPATEHPARGPGRARAYGTASDGIPVGTRPRGRARSSTIVRPKSRIDTWIGSYRVVRRLASGGTSVVYLARHSERGRAYALKVMRRHLSADPEMADRFEREAVVLSDLAHPGLPQLIDRGRTDDGSPYLVMNLLVGKTLADRLDLGRMSVPDILDIAHQAAGILSAVHAAGVVHCDIKPENLFLTPSLMARSRYRVVMIDFGAVSVPDLRPPGWPSLRPSRRLFGTPSYMAPEQCRTGSALDPRTDIYGFGCLLYEMLCGEPPFEGNIAEVIAAHQNAVRPRVSAIRPDTPEEVDELVLNMMASDPDRRPPAMSLVARALSEVMVRTTPDQNGSRS